MVLATAMGSNAVKVSLVMRLLSNSTLAKMIMMSALVCSSQPIKDPSPGSYLSILPAKCVPFNFPATAASNSTPATMNTAAPPSDQQHAVKQTIHLLLVEPMAIHDGARQEGADHKVQPRPVGAKVADGQPDLADIPAI